MNLIQLKSIDKSFELISDEMKFFGVSSISHITEPRDDSFIFCKNSKYMARIGDKSEVKKFHKTGIVFEKKYYGQLNENEKQQLEVQFGWLATVDSVAVAMTNLSKPFYDEKFKNINYMVDGRQMGTTEIDPSAEISQNVFIGENVIIGKNVKILSGVRVLPNVQIGDDTIIYSNTVIYPFVKIGKSCRIHANVSIGGDGFGYVFYQGEHQKIWHFGGVEISDKVELGANSTVDAGAFYPTRIGTGSKIDNHSTIGHNVQIGKHVVVCGQGAVAGSVEMDDYCVMGGKAGLGPDVRLGKGVQIAASAIVSEGSVIEAGEVLAGHPARPVKEWLRGLAFIRKSSLK